MRKRCSGRMERATGRASRGSGRQRRLLGWSGGRSGRWPRRLRRKAPADSRASFCRWKIFIARRGLRVRGGGDGGRSVAGREGAPGSDRRVRDGAAEARRGAVGTQGGRKYSDTGRAGTGEGALWRAHPAQPGRRGAREGYVWKLVEGEGAGDAGDGGGGRAGAEGAGDGGGGGGSAAVGDGVERDGEAGVRGRSWEVEELKSSRVEELKSS